LVFAFLKRAHLQLTTLIHSQTANQSFFKAVKTSRRNSMNSAQIGGKSFSVEIYQSHRMAPKKQKEFYSEFDGVKFLQVFLSRSGLKWAVQIQVVLSF
jgi:hypothetical protein